ncbi:transposase, partial [Clostridioides difficile]|uniref:RNA-guided endonuclease InsQ/TnpB family protein n=1 Tax=Clostridioides difficile TaxID=1496 RepID=UPI002A90DCEF
MIRCKKIRLKPTREQEILLRRSIGTIRFVFNWGLAKWEEMYKEGLNPNAKKIKKIFNNTIKKEDEYKWINEVPSQAIAETFNNLQKAFDNFLNGKAKYPRFKTKKKSKQSFYVRYDRMNIKEDTVNIEKIGRVKFITNYDIPIQKKYINPRCHYDGKYWYLTFGFEAYENQVEADDSICPLNKDLSIGIDLGITNLAVVSNIDSPIKNINK